MAVYDAPTPVEDVPPRKKAKHSANDTASSSAASAATAPLVRYLYYKSHSITAGADDGLKPGCTLFVVNLPFHYTQEHLTQVFSCFGSVESVAFLQSTSLQFDPTKIGACEPSSLYRSAHIVYEESESHDIAMATDLSRTPQPCPEESEDELAVGMKKWIATYHSTHPQVASLQLQVDKFMEGFDARTAQEKAAARSGAQVDADGWTLVKGATRGKKRAALAVEEESQRAREQAAKKAKKNTVVHFYKHQEREAKKERLISLREKFEADKAKIARMKATRSFKPM